MIGSNKAIIFWHIIVILHDIQLQRWNPENSFRTSMTSRRLVTTKIIAKNANEIIRWVLIYSCFDCTSLCLYLCCCHAVLYANSEILIADVSIYSFTLQAVKRSRNKSKQKSAETENRVKWLRTNNKILEEKIGKHEKDLKFLKDLFLAQAQTKADTVTPAVLKNILQSDDEDDGASQSTSTRS